MTEVVDAAVAVILRADGKVLLGQRPEGKSWAGWWEFPGGKVEDGETAAHALQREVHEELGIEATLFSPWITRIFAYPERTVRLHFFTVRQWQGEPHGRENQLLSWERPEAPSVGPLLPANAPVLEALRLPSLYAITNLAEMGETAFFIALECALRNGVRLIQVREKQMNRPELLDFVRKVLERTQPYDARVVVNGDIALAHEAGAHGVHLNSAALIASAQKPDDMICGASCHDADELARAAELGLDYVLLAPVKSTSTHPETPPLGWARFSDLAMDNPMPVYALGGMSADDLPVAWEHGAHGVAMMRAVWR